MDKNSMPNTDLSTIIANELNIPQASVAAVIELLNESATVPFIARYRKERTGGLDEVQIRTIEERQTYLNELNDRRNTIISAIETQGKMTPELKKQIEEAATKTALEDLYMPYKPKRRTRAMIAREKDSKVWQTSFCHRHWMEIRKRRHPPISMQNSAWNLKRMHSKALQISLPKSFPNRPSFAITCANT